MICSKEFIEQVKEYKEHFIQYNLEGIECSKIRSMLKELQEANQRDIEINPAQKQVDQNAEVWRYLISTDENLFFTREVLYIGQAYGKDGQRLAQDRLKTHNTLPTILSDCNMRYPDKRIYILLLEVNPILNSVMDGINGGSVGNIEEDIHFFNIFANPPQMNQIINIAEAALINYFKPKYNVNFKENGYGIFIENMLEH